VTTPSKPERSSDRASGEVADAQRASSRDGGASPTVDSEQERVRRLSRATLFGEPPPVTAQRYALRHRIGRGGLGVVYRAEDLRLRRDVALKFVRVPPGAGSDERELFREALTLARLSHRNIVPVLDVGRLGDEIFIAMELVQGTTLEVLLGRGPMPWRDTIRLFGELGDALAAAHRAGIVHGDVKPANVIVGDDGHPRLLDFGLARGVADAWGEPASTRSGSSRPSGTAGYLAPERHDGRQDGRTDQFALCVVLYRALFGRAPFDPTWKRLEPARLASVSYAGGSVPRSLAAIVRKGLAHAPEDRFADMAAFVEALGQVERSRRTTSFGVAAITIAGAIAAIVRPGDRCAFDDDPMAGVWDDRARGQLQANAPGESAARLVTALDRYATAWVDLRKTSCEAVAADAISPVLYDLRLSCLGRTREAVAYAIDRARATGFDAWPMAVATIDELTDIAACRDDAALLEGRPSDTTDPELHAAIHRGLDLAYVDQLLGDSASYLDRLLELERDRADVARAPEASLWLTVHIASALNLLGRHREAIDRARPALLEAQRRPRWRRTEGGLLLALSEATTHESSRPAEAVLLAEQAIATLEGSDASRPFVAAAYRVLAGASLAAGDAEAALAAARAAREHDDVPAPRSMTALATRAHEVATSNWEGLALAKLGRTQEAEAAYRRGLAAARPDDPRRFDLARVRNNLGLLLAATGRVEEAESMLRAAAELKRTIGLVDDAATTWMNLGNVQSRAGRNEAALASYAEALRQPLRAEIEARVRFNRAVTLQTSRRLDEAHADYAFVLTAPATTGAERRQRYAARIGLSRIELDRGDRAAALAGFEAALVGEPGDASTYDKAELRLGLGLAQPDDRRSQAIAQVRDALEIATVGRHADLVEQAQRWLDANAPR
jgi:tetratricopeptide (TPR) repeat protein